MKFNIITIFPEVVRAYLDASILKRAQDSGAVLLNAFDLREWTADKHKSVDDTPYGGGAGMIMKIEPLHKAIRDVAGEKSPKKRVVLLSAKGKKWDQKMAKRFSKFDEVTLVCGRYEGVDERVVKFVDEEVSIGDYVLTGGELGALVVVDSITRLLSGVLGNEGSLESESHNSPGVLEYPQYTRPEVFEVDGRKYRVPKVLLSGDHKKIEEWKKEMTVGRKDA